MKIPRPNTTTPLSPEARDRAVQAIKWAWFQMNGYLPHSAQRDCHVSMSRFLAAIAGTRGGKSRMAGEEVVPYLIVGPTRVWIVGQTYMMTEKEFRYVYDRMTGPAMRELFGDDYIDKCVYDEKGGNMQIRTKWGSEVKCISLDKAETAAFGDEVDVIIMSEPAQIKYPENVYQRILHGRLASRMGRLILPGTPSGKAPAHDPTSWVYNQYIKGLSGDPDYYTRQWPSWENPDFKDDPYWIRSWMNPKIFAEQYEGQFVVFSGAVYEAFNPDTHVIDPFRIPKFWNRYESIDPGYSGEFSWLAGVTGYDNTLYITDEYFTNKTLYIEHANNIWERRMNDYDLPFIPFGKPSENKNPEIFKTAASKNKAPSRLSVAIDPEDPQCIAELTQYSINGIKANNDVHVGIDRVDSRMRSPQPKLYVSSKCTHLIEAITNHSWGEKNGIQIRMPANDVYKHPNDILRYMCMMALSPSVNVEEIQDNPEPTLWEMMEEVMMTKNTMDYSRYDRRRSVEVYDGITR